MRFHASVVRSIFDFDTQAYHWTSSINGRDEQKHPTREEAMARIEHELAIAGEQFVAELASFRAQRGRNKFSMAVDGIGEGATCSRPFGSDQA